MKIKELQLRINEELSELEFLKDEIASQRYLTDKLKDPDYRQAILRSLEGQDELVRILQSPDNQLRREVEGIAGKLSNYYTGVERIFSVVVKYIDRDRITGENSHAQLLERVSKSTEKRNIVISTSLKDELMQVKDFRNRERHNYPRTLKPEIVLNAALQLPLLHERLGKEVREFLEFLSLSLLTGTEEVSARKSDDLKKANREQYMMYLDLVPPMKPAVGIFTRWENQEKADIAIAFMILSENQGNPKQGENRVRQVLSQSDRVLELRAKDYRPKIGQYINSMLNRARANRSKSRSKDNQKSSGEEIE